MRRSIVMSNNLKNNQDAITMFYMLGFFCQLGEGDKIIVYDLTPPYSF